MKSVEQEARDMLERMGVEDAQSRTAGDVVELANLINENAGLAMFLKRALRRLPKDDFYTEAMHYMRARGYFDPLRYAATKCHPPEATPR